MKKRVENRWSIKKFKDLSKTVQLLAIGLNTHIASRECALSVAVALFDAHNQAETGLLTLLAVSVLAYYVCIFCILVCIQLTVHLCTMIESEVNDLCFWFLTTVSGRVVMEILVRGISVSISAGICEEVSLVVGEHGEANGHTIDDLRVTHLNRNNVQIESENVRTDTTEESVGFFYTLSGYVFAFPSAVYNTLGGAVLSTSLYVSSTIIHTTWNVGAYMFNTTASVGSTLWNLPAYLYNKMPTVFSSYTDVIKWNQVSLVKKPAANNNFFEVGIEKCINTEKSPRSVLQRSVQDALLIFIERHVHEDKDTSVYSLQRPSNEVLRAAAVTETLLQSEQLVNQLIMDIRNNVIVSGTIDVNVPCGIVKTRDYLEASEDDYRLTHCLFSKRTCLEINKLSGTYADLYNHGYTTRDTGISNQKIVVAKWTVDKLTFYKEIAKMLNRRSW